MTNSNSTIFETACTNAAKAATLMRDLGLPECAISDLLRETAYRRHSYRVSETLKACGIVNDFSKDQWSNMAVEEIEIDNNERKQAAAIAAILLIADLLGVGGTWDGTSGEGTARSETFRACGTGRKQAGDGGAWMSAAEAALRLCLDQSGKFRLHALANSCDSTVSFYCVFEDLTLTCLVEVPQTHAATLCRAMARSAAGLKHSISELHSVYADQYSPGKMQILQTGVSAIIDDEFKHAYELSFAARVLNHRVNIEKFIEDHPTCATALNDLLIEENESRADITVHRAVTAILANSQECGNGYAWTLAAQVCDRDNCGKAAREAVSAWISYLRECKDSK